MRTVSRETGKRAASLASDVLRASGASQQAKSAAASALSQRKSVIEVTSAAVASKASAVMRNSHASAAAKAAAASALSQRSRGK